MTSQFTKLFSFILANVHDPAAPDDAAMRLPCFSCMSPYLENHYSLYLQHLYRRPASFDQHCDWNTFDRSYLLIRNCTDTCVTLRLNDVVGGRRRVGMLRGCLSDLIGYNQSIFRGLTGQHWCLDTTLRQLFLPTASRQELEPTRLTLCGCHNGLCNGTASSLGSLVALFLLLYQLLKNS